MLGNPKFSIYDLVRFKLDDGIERQGLVYVVDAYGTFEQNEDVSYDIMVTSENCLYKHVKEKFVEAKEQIELKYV